jgi:hypothetical protein
MGVDMKLQLGIQELRPFDTNSEDPLIGEEMTSSSIVRNLRSGGKPVKVPYKMIRIAWEEARKEDPKFTKAELARRLGLNVSTVRGVLNRHKSYRDRELRHLAGGKKQTLIFAW